MGVDRINEIIRNHNVEFLDFGCSTGGSINRFSSMIKGSPVGLGLDIDPLKVATTRSAGYLAEVCDITELADQGIKVRFVSMSHFLEHIPDPGAIARILKVACRIARDFIIIVQPNFDLDAYLFRNGKKFYWSDWSGHPNRMTNLGSHNIFYPLWEKGGDQCLLHLCKKSHRNAR